MFKGVFALLICLSAGFASTTQPSSQPATAPAERQILAHGLISYAPPSGWQRLGTGENPNAAMYRSPDQTATILIINTPQEAPLTESLRLKLSQAIARKIREDLQSQGHQSIMPPRLEEDADLYLCIHDQFRAENRDTDRLHLYRVMGMNLLMVSVSTWADSPQANADAFQTARQMLIDAQLHLQQEDTTQPAEPAQPASLPKAGLQISPPSGWKAELHDLADGLIATFEDPQFSDNKILLLSQSIPPESRNNPEARAALIDQLAGRALKVYQPESGRPGTPSQINDRRFIRKTVIQHYLSDGRVEVCCRMVRVDQVLIEVVSIARSEQSRTVMRLADQLALQIRPLAETK